MDPKLLKVLRAMLGLDEKSLPDSMTADEFGKFVEKQKGKLFGNPEDIKNLQKIITTKDVELKKALDKVVEKKDVDEKDKSEADKKIDALTDNVTKLTEVITNMHGNQRTKDLSEKYPDILPELLAGKNDEEVDALVVKQREKNQKLYGDSQHFAPPGYESVDEVDEAIKAEKADDKESSEMSAVKVLQLGREKSEFK